MYGAMQEGGILFFLRRFFEKSLAKLPLQVEQKLRKPLFDCMFCMSSVWGCFFVFIPLPYFLDVILSVAGLNFLLMSLLEYFKYRSEDEESFKHNEIKGFHLNDK